LVLKCAFTSNYRQANNNAFAKQIARTKAQQYAA